MLNKIILMGRLTKDPELRKTQTGKSVVSFTLAVDRDYQKDACDFIDIVAWEGTAEFVNRYFFKGKMCLVEGSLQSRKWSDKQGNNRTSWEVQAKSVYFGDDKKRGQAQMDGGVSDGYAAGEPEYNETGPRYQNQGGGNPFDDGRREQESFYDPDDGGLPF